MLARPWTHRRLSGGFTLLEVLVVVIIVGALAAAAIPAISRRLKANRTREAGQRVAELYRVARVQALGSGRATLVRYADASGVGNFEVRQRSALVTPGTCEIAQVSACGDLSNWTSTGTDNQLIGGASIGGDLGLEMFDPADAAVTSADVCFTPLGRAFLRIGAATAFTPMTGSLRAEVFRGTTADRVGLTRHVVIPPNGAARSADTELKGMP